jgi:hypothetical protein
MKLLEAITLEQSSFPEIAARLGQEVTTELRAEMARLIEEGQVIKTGNKRWTRYQLGMGAHAAQDATGWREPAKGATMPPVASNAPTVAPMMPQPPGFLFSAEDSEPDDFVEPESPIKEIKEVRSWEWVDKSEIHPPVQFNPDLTSWIEHYLNNRIVRVNPGTIVDVACQLHDALKIGGVSILDITDSLTQLAHRGQIRVKRLVNPSRYDTPHQYGVWEEEK